tara:strand:- start:305 stop:526 length:222 start_codon:yes stop_codon:yes gene_type:complete
MRTITISRQIGSVLVVSAYFIVLHYSVLYGTILHTIACLLSIPFFIRTRAYDVVAMLSFMVVVSASKLIQMLL